MRGMFAINMILCSQSCKHQKDGCCALEQITQLTNVKEVKCGYYEPMLKPFEKEEQAFDTQKNKHDD